MVSSLVVWGCSLSPLSLEQSLPDLPLSESWPRVWPQGCLNKPPVLGRQCGLLGTIAALTQALYLDLTSQGLGFVSDLLRGWFWSPAAPFWYQVLCMRAICTLDLALGALLMLHANCFTPVLSAQPLVSCPLPTAQLLRLKRPGGFHCCSQAKEFMEGRSWQDTEQTRGSKSLLSAYLEGDADLILIKKIPWRRKWQPILVFLPGKSHGQRSLAGYSPWGYKESDIA